MTTTNTTTKPVKARANAPEHRVGDEKLHELDEGPDFNLEPPPTSVPCPPWCNEPAGHGYDSELPNGDLCRSHGRLFGTSGPSATGDAGPQVDVVAMGIWHEGREDVTGMYATVQIGGNVVGELYVADLRRLAAAATEAADLMDTDPRR